MTDSLRVLSGIKVLDLSRVLAGPWSTQILADFGADVVKVEAPGRGDDTRAWGSPIQALDPSQEVAGESAYYLSTNRNKRSLAIDLADPRGADLIRKLAAEADIVVENFKVGGLQRYGLDYQTLSAINPRLIYCSITGFGQDGPYADRPGYDFVAQAMGGMMSITGEADGPPIKTGVAVADLSTGLYATISILMALRHAEQTGQGQHIDCSLLDTQLAMLANQGSSYLVSGQSPSRMGNTHPTVVPYQVFDAADGPMVVAVGNDGQFKILCKVLGVPDLAADPRFVTNVDRMAHRDALIAILQDLICQRQGGELITALTDAGAPAGPVNSVKQALDDPFVEARQAVHHFTRQDGYPIPTIAFPAKLSRTPAAYDRAPPRLGEHTDEVLRDWLGMD
ncbi:MAG: CaiB/BaiF CoA-transferase family protein, partial [Caulobacteraceae bacterium]|nr:CaiB/BaiF CoA-transferase family protein [Caulobacteraceae bacterium]